MKWSPLAGVGFHPPGSRLAAAACRAQFFQAAAPSCLPNTRDEATPRGNKVHKDLSPFQLSVDEGPSSPNLFCTMSSGLLNPLTRLAFSVIF